MIGVLDSGMGGENTLAELRRIIRSEDVILLKDKKNAPYGTKSAEELTSIVREKIRALVDMGAESVLIACCTASCIWNRLPEHERAVSYPIIDRIAKKARSVTKSGRIAVIATEGTVSSGAFLSRLGDMCRVQIPAGELVELVERGVFDGTVGDRDAAVIKDTLIPLEGLDCDTLILGCTHFPSLEKTIYNETKKYGIKSTVSSAREGAKTLMDALRRKEHGTGRTVRIET